MAEDNKIHNNYKKTIVDNYCDKMRNLINILIKWIRAISYLTFNARKILMRLRQIFVQAKFFTILTKNII